MQEDYGIDFSPYNSQPDYQDITQGIDFSPYTKQPQAEWQGPIQPKSWWDTAVPYAEEAGKSFLQGLGGFAGMLAGGPAKAATDMSDELTSNLMVPFLKTNPKTGHLVEPMDVFKRTAGDVAEMMIPGNYGANNPLTRELTNQLTNPEMADTSLLGPALRTGAGFMGYDIPGMRESIRQENYPALFGQVVGPTALYAALGALHKIGGAPASELRPGEILGLGDYAPPVEQFRPTSPRRPPLATQPDWMQGYPFKEQPSLFPERPAIAEPEIEPPPSGWEFPGEPTPGEGWNTGINWPERALAESTSRNFFGPREPQQMNLKMGPWRQGGKFQPEATRPKSYYGGGKLGPEIAELPEPAPTGPETFTPEDRFAKGQQLNKQLMDADISIKLIQEGLDRPGLTPDMARILNTRLEFAKAARKAAWDESQAFSQTAPQWPTDKPLPPAGPVTNEPSHGWGWGFFIEMQDNNPAIPKGHAIATLVEPTEAGIAKLKEWGFRPTEKKGPDPTGRVPGLFEQWAKTEWKPPPAESPKAMPKLPPERVQRIPLDQKAKFAQRMAAEGYVHLFDDQNFSNWLKPEAAGLAKKLLTDETGAMVVDPARWVNELFRFFRQMPEIVANDRVIRDTIDRSRLISTTKEAIQFQNLINSRLKELGVGEKLDVNMFGLAKSGDAERIQKALGDLTRETIAAGPEVPQANRVQAGPRQVSPLDVAQPQHPGQLDLPLMGRAGALRKIAEAPFELTPPTERGPQQISLELPQRPDPLQQQFNFDRAAEGKEPIPVPWKRAGINDLDVNAIVNHLQNGNFTIERVTPDKSWLATQPTIKPGEYESRAFTPRQVMEGFEGTHGRRPPIIVRKGGKTYITEGHHTFNTAMERGADTLAAVVDLDRTPLQNFIRNEQGATPIDWAEKIAENLRGRASAIKELFQAKTVDDLKRSFRVGMGERGERPESSLKMGELWSLSKNLVASFDFSGVRQVLPLIYSPHFWKGFEPMIKASGLFSKSGAGEVYFEAMRQALKRDLEIFHEDVDANGKVIPSVAARNGWTLRDLASNRMEQVASNWAEGSGLPDNAFTRAYAKTGGRVVRGSNRAFTMMRNYVGSTHLQYLFDAAREVSNAAGERGTIPEPGVTGLLGRKRGFTIEQAVNENPYVNDVRAKELVDFVRTVTGDAPLRTTFGHPAFSVDLERNVRGLTKIFFAPRNIAKQVRMLNPTTYVMASPFVRKQYMKAMLATAGVAYMVPRLVKAYADATGHKDDVSVDYDPRSADFLKLRVGNTRFDFGQGIQQYVVLMDRLAQGQYISSATHKLHYTGKEYGDMTRGQLLANFGINKLDPMANFAVDWVNASTDQPFQIGDRMLQLAIPMTIGDFVETYRQSPALFFGGLGPTLLGMGSQTYGRHAAGSAANVRPRYIPRNLDIVNQGYRYQYPEWMPGQ